MDTNLFSQNRDILNNLIAENSEIGIIIGEPHSLDRVAASLALYLSLQQIGKDTQIISRREPIVEYSNLVGIDRVKKEFSGLTKTFTISLPYVEGEIEKVSYKIEGDRLNINLFAGERKISFSEKDVDYIKRGAIPSLIFVISVSEAERLASFFDHSPDIKLVNIDTSPLNDSYGDIAYVEPSFSSLSEIVGKIITDLGLPMDIDIAQNLMDGVTSATNNFTAPTTSPFAFEAASFLLKHGAKRKTGQETTPTASYNRIPVTPVYRTSNFQSPPQRPVPDTYEQRQNNNNADENEEVPQDWFAPKVFKGSSGK